MENMRKIYKCSIKCNIRKKFILRGVLAIYLNFHFQRKLKCRRLDLKEAIDKRRNTEIFRTNLIRSWSELYGISRWQM